MPEPLKYRTIVAPASAEFRDRGSKFLAFCFPVSYLAQVKSSVKNLKLLHPKANHHCVAFRLGHDGNQFRASDDGEPAGSAGKPMLGSIDKLGLTNVLIVVVRYFGGTLLGVPGLINAYSTAATEALLQAEISEHWIEQLWQIDCNYECLGEVLHILKKNEVVILSQDLQLFCRLKVGIPQHLVEACSQTLSAIRSVVISALIAEI